MELVNAGSEYNIRLWEYVIGSIDFRICNGRGERSRRPRASWWADCIGHSTPQRIKPVPKESSLDQWCEWYRKAAGRRLLQIAEILGITPIEVFIQLIEDLGPANTVVPAIVEARKRVIRQ